MPLIQGGPPQWIWERTPDPIKCEVTPVNAPEGQTLYELKISCGLEIVKVQFFTPAELKDFVSVVEAIVP
jgi:hypothetical protein